MFLLIFPEKLYVGEVRRSSSLRSWHFHLQNVQRSFKQFVVFTSSGMFSWRVLKFTQL